MPDLQEQQLSSQDDFLILASDGLWDVLANQDAAQLIKDIKVHFWLLQRCSCASLSDVSFPIFLGQAVTDILAAEYAMCEVMLTYCHLSIDHDLASDDVSAD